MYNNSVLCIMLQTQTEQPTCRTSDSLLGIVVIG